MFFSLDPNKEVINPYPRQCDQDEALVIIKAEQRMENTQGLNRRQLAREQRMLRSRRERKLQGPRVAREGCPGKSKILCRHFRVYWKQSPLNDIIDTGSIVKINFIQGSKYTENFLPIKIKTLLQEYNYFGAIKAGRGLGLIDQDQQDTVEKR